MTATRRTLITGAAALTAYAALPRAVATRLIPLLDPGELAVIVYLHGLGNHIENVVREAPLSADQPVADLLGQLDRAGWTGGQKCSPRENGKVWHCRWICPN